MKPLLLVATLFCFTLTAYGAPQSAKEKEAWKTYETEMLKARGRQFNIAEMMVPGFPQAKTKDEGWLSKLSWSEVGKFVRRLTKTRTAPPVLNGTLQFVKIGNGSTPIVGMWFAGTVSDPDGSIVKVTWEFGDGTSFVLPGSATLVGINRVYRESSHYVVKYTVEDNSGETTSITSYVETPENTAPRATIDANFDPIAPMTVNYEVLASDPESTNFKYEFYACGGFVYTATANCTYPTAGTYPFGLRVTDALGTAFDLSGSVTLNGTTFKSTPFSVIRGNTFAGMAPLAVDFDASASFDMDGGPVTYRWNILTSATPKPVSTSTSSKFSYMFSRPGTYVVELFVKDDEGVETRSVQEIHVMSDNVPRPRIIAYYAAPRAVTFENSQIAFDVPAGRNGNFFWNFGDGTTSVGINQFKTYAAPGTYTVNLTYYDIIGYVRNIQKTITIGNTDDSPVVVQTPSNYQPLIGQDVSFSSTGTYDPQGAALDYRWIFFEDEIEGYQSSFTRQFEDRGLKDYQLLVTNSRGLTARGYGGVEARDVFATLVTEIFFNPKVGVAPLTVNFDASQTVSETPLVFHQWNTAGNIFSNSATATYTFNTPGQHYVSYYVKNAAGEEARGFRGITVLDPLTIPSDNQSPVARIGVSGDPSTRSFGLGCYDSSDPDGTIIGCEWKVNGIPASDVFFLNHKYTENILYTVELTVVDNWGARNTVIRQFDFSPTPAQFLSYDYAPLAPVSGGSVRFNAGATRIVGKPIKSYQWDFADGGTGSGLSADHTFAAAGNYVVQLTVTAVDDTTYTVSKMVEVHAIASSFAMTMTAQAVDLAGRVPTSGTYRAYGAPESILFNADASASSPVAVKDATWDFGDGTTGLGVNVEHTYHKPGTYTVEVTATDWNNNTDTAEITVIVPRVNDCYAAEGDTICLHDEAADVANVSPNASKWVIGHDLGAVNFSTSPADYPAGWIKLISQKAGGKTYNIASATIVAGDQLEIERAKLPREIDLSAPHTISIVAKSSTGAPLIGSLPLRQMGKAKLTVDVGQTGMRLEVVNPSAGISKQLDLGASTTSTISGLPVGEYAIIASKNQQSVVQTVQLKAGSQSISMALAKKKLQDRKSLSLSSVRSLHAKLGKRSSWSQSLCGEPSPFAAAKVRTLDAGEARAGEFSSVTPMSQAKFKLALAELGHVQLSCSIVSPGLLYGQNKWKYQDGPARCWNDERPHAYWQDYLASLGVEDLPVVIKYELRDELTDQRQLGHIVTSASDLMREEGLRLQDLSARIGLPEADGLDWGHRFQREIVIPAHFLRPQIRFELYAHHDSSPSAPYSVTCDVRNTNTAPKLANLEASSMNAATHSAAENGRLSLSKRFGMFPVQHDDRTTSPLAIQSNIAKGEYRAVIRYFNRSDVIWQGMELTFRYGGRAFTKIYDFSGVAETNTRQGTYTNSFIVDTADLKNRFRWVRGEKNVEVVFTPVGKILSNYDYRGQSKTMSWTALFDAKTVKANVPQICTAGLYPAEFTAFVKDDLLAALLDAYAEGVSVRCGEMSAPFGGPLNISSSWKRQGQQHGTEAKIRSFNTTPGTQDSYDTFTGSALRRGDMEAYMTFLTAIKNLIAIVDEEQGGSPTAKKLLVDYCNPVGGPVVSPCLEDTTFGNITERMAHDLCLINARIPNIRPPGCPMPVLSKLTRFSRWVELNRTTFGQLLKRTSLEGMMASGQLTPDSSVLDNGWQESALAKGQWPSGYPIHRVVSGDTWFTSDTLESCETNPVHCSLVQKLFTNETTHFDGLTIKTGWR